MKKSELRKLIREVIEQQLKKKQGPFKPKPGGVTPQARVPQCYYFTHIDAQTVCCCATPFGCGQQTYDSSPSTIYGELYATAEGCAEAHGFLPIINMTNVCTTDPEDGSITCVTPCAIENMDENGNCIDPGITSTDIAPGLTI